MLRFMFEEHADENCGINLLVLRRAKEIILEMEFM